MMFMLQNKAATSLLRETQGMASIKETLAAKVPGLKRENIAHARAWMNIFPSGFEKYRGENWWPVYFSVSYSDSSRSKCDVALILDKGYANSEEEGEKLRDHLKIFDARFAKHQSTDRRQVVLKEPPNKSDFLLPRKAGPNKYAAFSNSHADQKRLVRRFLNNNLSVSDLVQMLDNHSTRLLKIIT